MQRVEVVSASGVRGSIFFGNDHLNATNCELLQLQAPRGRSRGDGYGGYCGGYDAPGGCAGYSYAVLLRAMTHSVQCVRVESGRGAPRPNTNTEHRQSTEQTTGQGI
eukprot:scaffold27021_cov160-Isochrysis_galbana.AAC.3